MFTKTLVSVIDLVIGSKCCDFSLLISKFWLIPDYEFCSSDPIGHQLLDNCRSDPKLFPSISILSFRVAKSSFSALYYSFWVEWWKGGKASGGNYFGSRMPRNYCYPFVQYILSKITSIKQGFYMLFIVTCHILLYRRKKIKPKSVTLQHKIDGKNINRGRVR